MTCLDRWQHLPRICLALVPLVACLFAADVQGLVSAQGGKTDYHIYVGASAAPAERRAAEELAAFLKQATGATFPIVHTREQATGPRLVVGVNELTKKTLRARPESGLLGDDGFQNPHARGLPVCLRGLATGHTVWGLLFLGQIPGLPLVFIRLLRHPDSEIGPPGKIDERQVPRFSYREVFSRDADDPVFSARNRLNGQFRHRLARFLKDAPGGAVSIRGINIVELVKPAKYQQGHPSISGAVNCASGSRRCARSQ